MLAGVYEKLARPLCFALYCQRTCGIDAVNAYFILVAAGLRCGRIAAVDSVFRAVRQNNGCAVGQLYRGGCRSSKVNAFERKGLGGVIPNGIFRTCLGAVQQCYCRRTAVGGGKVCSFGSGRCRKGC